MLISSWRLPERQTFERIFGLNSHLPKGLSFAPSSTVIVAIFQFTQGNPTTTKPKYATIIAAFTLTALSLTGMFIPVLHAQENPAPPPLMKVDHNHWTTGFAIPILGGLSEVTGKFTDFGLAVVYDEAGITKSSINTATRVTSIDTGIADRDKDLRSAGFFDMEKFQPSPS